MVTTNLINDCKKYCGHFPYDTWDNCLINNPQFLNIMKRKYGIRSVEKEIKRMKRRRIFL